MPANGFRFPEELWVIITDLKRHKPFRAELATALARATVDNSIRWEWVHTVGRAVHYYFYRDGCVLCQSGENGTDCFPYAKPMYMVLYGWVLPHHRRP